MSKPSDRATQNRRAVSGLWSESARYRGPFLSALAHGAVLLGVVIVAHQLPHVAPFKLPGTAKGVVPLTYYSPGSRRRAMPSEAAVRTQSPQAPKVIRRKPVPESPKTPPAPRTDPGTGTAAESGLGDGDISIALLRHFPEPQPDLSSLPPGAKGDVILDAVIDEYGNITGLTLLRGLGSAIDDAVIATVKQWSFRPATKNGVPVSSEQELHFHYERG